MRFEFATAGRIVVGPGTAAELPSLLAETFPDIGMRAMLVWGRGAASRGGPVAAVSQALRDQGLLVCELLTEGEPDVAAAAAGAERARDFDVNLLIGLGGGSALDLAKAIAGLAPNAGSPLDYLEVVGQGKPLRAAPLPVVAVPTTAGTGSEVTRNAVLGVPDHRAKVSLRAPGLLPRLAVVDSALTHNLPPAETAAGGMDALVQLLEASVCRRAQPITEGFCEIGLPGCAAALRRAFQDPHDAAAREIMSTAALLSGLALANAGLGAVHGIAAPLGGAFPAPHGAICAALAGPVTAVNLRALRERAPGSDALDRYRKTAERLIGPGAVPEDLPPFLYDLAAELNIPLLRHYGLEAAAVPGLAQAALGASSTRGNPIDLQPEELELAIEAARTGGPLPPPAAGPR